ncbi:uncharacterized protein LOC135691349 isoform X2 [Rhopilema esculentum]|uniref:uncharacterized protein LOC135691349 isoform X2 n=1 Tax=Rhopilema esculentum TaxID=499914 RepID=UPI0031DF1952
MENLEKDKKKRSLFRRNVTKLVNKVKDILDSPDVEDGLVEHLRKELLERQIELKEVDDKILDSLLEIEETDEQELDRESEEASSYKEKISFAISRIDRFLKPPERNSHNTRSLSQDSLNSNSSSETKLVKKVNIKLPKLELKKFGGKIHEWPEFWDGFQSVHGNPDLADCDKFKYLKSFLEEPARRVVAGMPMTEENYKIAVDLLQKRFGRKEVIQQAHIGHLMGLQPVFNEKSTTRLRNLHDEIETHFRGLEAMGVNKYSYSSIVVPCLMEKIPENMRSQMIRNSRENYLSWAVDDLLAYMEQELHIKECQVPFAKKENAEFGARPRLDRGHGGTASSLHVGSKTEEGSCVFCRKGHAPEACNNVKGAERRRNMLMRYAKCFLCLRSGHRAYNCRSNLNCSTCKGRHNVAICSKAEKVQFDKLNRSDKETEGNRSSAAQLSPNAPSWIGSTGSGGNVALQTAAAKVNGHRLRVLFDSGSHRSFITSQTVSKLGLEIVREETLGIKPFGSESAEYKVREVVRVPLSSQDGMRKIVIECFVVDNISNISNVHPEVVRKSYPHLHEIWFSDVCRLETLTVEILVGSDFMWSFMEGEIKRGGPGEPVGVKTALGWVLSGPLEGNKLISYEFNVNFVPEETSTLFVRQDLDLHNKIDKLWNLDSIGIKEENNVYEMVLDNLTFDGKRYSVGLPWKTGHKILPTNFDNAYGRLNSLVNKLKKNPSHFKKYDDIIREQVEQGIVEQVTDLELAAETHYLPHMAVIREEAETTKVRIVFDASSKDKKQGTSLNDCLHVGPSLTPLIFDILLRFRENKVALVGDIEKAFLSIEVDAADRDFLRKLEGKAYGAPPTAQLPDFRVTMAKPFANVGIDFAGPLYIKASNSEMTKVYICLFSCCVTRALHLELVQDLSASVFLNCLRRFCAKRGTPEVINSDNAKTFKATAKFLKKLSNNQEIKTFLEIKRIKWKFNLEVSPWQGGHFERMVRSVKRCLRKVLGNAKVSHDELCTLLAEVECVLNNRPLTYLYDELGGEVLTPSHLVMGRRLNLLSSGIEYRNKSKENQSSLTKRFLHLTRLLNHFWNRWKKEYLVNLRESHKMVSNKQQVIRTGDIVLVQDDNLKRGEWKVAKVEELIAGKDGHVRGAKVRRVGKGKYEILNRPIQKLYPFVDAGEEVKESKKEGNVMHQGGKKQEKGNAVEGRSENEQQDQSQAHQATGTRDTRAAARDARLKTKLLLDS